LDVYHTIKNLIDFKIGDEIIFLNEDYFIHHTNASVFIDDNNFFVNGSYNLKLFRKYLIQQNIIIISRFYNQINLSRIAQLCNINETEIEAEICDLVMNQIIFAKINRILKTVYFVKKHTQDLKINSMNQSLKNMLDNLETTCHLIHKENLKYNQK